MDKLPEDENSIEKGVIFRPHHVSITVKDPEKSRNFYKLFGFKEVFRWSDSSTTVIHMKLNDLILEIFSFKETESSSDQRESLEEELKIIGVKHFALRVKDIQKAKKFLSEIGIVPENTRINKGRTGILYFFIRDPDGIFVEIVQDDRNI
ncbi:MAG TPA: glyoxalase/bleomycin resistance/dioxygenase family protein [Persephonella sp.]|uniref:Glyoxalase family protein n=1 Tax=Persephonella marina (strain DSM 14350 / EX-H1) TaxID=123214 RepID=C0QPV8_PERMH|nr:MULTISPECIES: VOC family protein [Persephonella]ACO04253.1 glyoxalase family protein [Persephonella marina EX-H1]HCB69681.1 glyoxalase/bleomycin resistance/dioxygenase family protein [Persephonella sp.]